MSCMLDRPNFAGSVQEQRFNVGVGQNFCVRSRQWDIVNAGGSDNNLIGWVAVEISRQAG